MSDDNPFARLGLQKEMVESLRRQGRLNEFLRTYYRSIQAYVHPDKGGDTALAAAVNTAYDAIQQHPGSIDSWVRGMSDGNSVNPEHLAIIEGLTAKVEELQAMEGDYRNLQQQYAELLASRTGSVKAKVRKAAPRAEWKEHDFSSDDFEDDSARVEDTPAVKKPRAERVDAAGTTARAGAKKRTVSEVEPIVLSGLISYDLAGRPSAYNLTMDGEAVRTADGSYLLSSQSGFEKFFASEKKGRLPSTRELYALMERLYDTENPALSGIVRDLRESWFSTETKIDYSKNIIIHPGFKPIKCAIPIGNYWLKEIIEDEKWKTILQALFGPKDVGRVPELLQRIGGKLPYIWTASAENRKSFPKRAVWLNVGADRFLLNCDSNPIYNLGRARRVRRVEDAAGAREKI